LERKRSRRQQSGHRQRANYSTSDPQLWPLPADLRLAADAQCRHFESAGKVYITPQGIGKNGTPYWSSTPGPSRRSSERTAQRRARHCKSTRSKRGIPTGEHLATDHQRGQDQAHRQDVFGEEPAPREYTKVIRKMPRRTTNPPNIAFVYDVLFLSRRLWLELHVENKTKTARSQRH